MARIEIRKRGFSRRAADHKRGWILFTVLVNLALWAYWTKPVPEIDYRMESACAMPRHEGEATFIVVIEGKLICWRMI